LIQTDHDSLYILGAIALVRYSYNKDSCDFVLKIHESRSLGFFPRVWSAIFVNSAPNTGKEIRFSAGLCCSRLAVEDTGAENQSMHI